MTKQGNEWDDSTKGSLLRGDALPPQGIEVVMISVRTDMMDRRDGPGEERVFIAAFEPNNALSLGDGKQQEWVMNRTSRKWLKDNDLVTGETIDGFEPIPLLLIPNETNLGTGIKPILRMPNGTDEPVKDDVPF